MEGRAQSRSKQSSRKVFPGVAKPSQAKLCHTHHQGARRARPTEPYAATWNKGGGMRSRKVFPGVKCSQGKVFPGVAKPSKLGVGVDVG